MKYFVVFSCTILVSHVCTIPLPQSLTLEEFNSVPDEETQFFDVNIVGDYTQV